eukprot:scaffold6.g2743.t1
MVVHLEAMTRQPKQASDGASNGVAQHPSPHPQSRLRAVLQLALCVAGIYGAYLTQGVVQEALSTKKFGTEGERFRHLSALNGVQSWVCCLWAALLMLVSDRRPPAERQHQPPFTAYWRAAVTNFVGPACGLEALKYISYPAQARGAAGEAPSLPLEKRRGGAVPPLRALAAPARPASPPPAPPPPATLRQVLAKSSKMIPVMLLGTLLHGKRYSLLEYACCFAISGGVGLFALRSSGKVVSKLASPNAPLGYTLCLLNLVLDGYTNAAQDEIHWRYRHGSALHMMCWMNFWCGLYYVPALFLFSSVGRDLLAFCLKHPEASEWHSHPLPDPRACSFPTTADAKVNVNANANANANACLSSMPLPLPTLLPTPLPLPQAGCDILLFCACGALGQLFIFATIRAFGSLVNTLVTTTRKFFNILLSVLWNGNPLLPQQWGAVALVFGGLLVSSISKSRLHRPHKPHQH